MANFPKSFYRGAAIASFLSVATTLALIFFPRLVGSAESLEHRLLLADHPAAELRAWLYLLHPFLVLTAALGVAVALRRVAPVAATAEVAMREILEVQVATYDARVSIAWSARVSLQPSPCRPQSRPGFIPRSSRSRVY